VRGGRDTAFEVERKVRVFTCATSFGGTESLLEHRASVEGAATRSPESLLRLSIGSSTPTTSSRTSTRRSAADGRPGPGAAGRAPRGPRVAGLTVTRGGRLD
jgi:hypothetical protein